MKTPERQYKVNIISLKLPIVKLYSSFLFSLTLKFCLQIEKTVKKQDLFRRSSGIPSFDFYFSCGLLIQLLLLF